MSKVSIYIPTHNRIDLLKRAIKSVFSQTYKNWELLIVNDASEDGTREYLDNLTKIDSRVKVFHNEYSLGACSSRNIAIKNATGYYITGLDDDDYFTENRIESLLSDYDSKYSFISHCHKIDNGKRVKKCLSYEGDFCLKDILNKNFVGNQVFTETDKIRSVNGFDESLPAWQDYDLWVRLTIKYGIFKKIKKYTYIMDIAHEKDRITNSAKPAKGSQIFIDKYEMYSSDRLQKNKIIKKIIDKEKISFTQILKVIDKDNFVGIIKYVSR
ncbi:glycosyltransferase [Vibrio parahaemolyticus]|uniref:glycosyltransferase n=1 Tax=Vibrio parahaemolyticus TaxID=670 RepID=UPI001D3494D7|nr:glycosyltransferase [Vibrio parahaemolyticus]EHH2482019.1 glycosyltransferase [Vibrio parahaemolyticus]ELA8096627.1 glycosyltransferase [Vibrio parahaemolyticus]MDF5448284.1 glycosyltransferase [Vibrio parahaemolyticus]MDF5610951.1 glycosyltransferase [Vibrio parahaemolyticus]MEA5328826.1 glycosyltransferase [Vibrio parahaemolyticus]